MMQLYHSHGHQASTSVAGAIFLQGFGEHLWRRFVPKYLESFGAPVAAIGLFGTAEDFLDGVYQYPGGWLADRYGRRRALEVVLVVASVGYVIYLAAPGWPALFVGLVFVSAWNSMGQPTLFAVVGDSMPAERRTMGFTIQAIVRRVPLAIAPTIGGLLIAAFGLRGGMRTSLAATVLITAVTLAVVARVNVPLSASRSRSAVWLSRRPHSSAACSGASALPCHSSLPAPLDSPVPGSSSSPCRRATPRNALGDTSCFAFPSP